MRIAEIDELPRDKLDREMAVRLKGGILPYYIDGDGQVQCLFVIPSDPAYGGPHPQIVKGRGEPGETAQQMAVREAEEEIGLPRSKIKTLWQCFSGEIRGLVRSYGMVVFAAEIDPKFQPKLDREIARVLWLTPQEFMRSGRAEQRAIIQSFMQRLR